ncbi:nuclear transport factor 2 family protein [Pseudorhodoferax sp.]|uniref:nuclear transport factor 2 family protein n=1 Tax=Pseudorhodoferax sp. TaxID=1993553 RepID=UPI002DD61959|nr:nuclear transport factor 2 family protein [Pseudorhodoferax sp.]
MNTVNDYQAIAQQYIAAWNATGAARAAAIAQAFAPDARYTDPMMQARGHAALDQMIGAAQQQFGGLRFHLDGAADGHGERMRFRWTLGPDAETAIAKGTDFATLAGDGRLAEVSGFLDLVPQAG